MTIDDAIAELSRLREVHGGHVPLVRGKPNGMMRDVDSFVFATLPGLSHPKLCLRVLLATGIEGPNFDCRFCGMSNRLREEEA